MRDLTRLERILERAGEHLKALRAILGQGGGAGGRGPRLAADPVSNAGKGDEKKVSLRDRAGPEAIEDGWDAVCPDLSDASSTAEAIQRCLAHLVQGKGTAVLADTKGFLIAGVGSSDRQESLAAVGALAAQMAFRSSEFLEEMDPKTLLVASKGDHFVGTTFFPVEGDVLVLVLAGPGTLHRGARVRQVFEWIRPLLSVETSQVPTVVG